MQAIPDRMAPQRGDHPDPNVGVALAPQKGEAQEFALEQTIPVPIRPNAKQKAPHMMRRLAVTPEKPETLFGSRLDRGRIALARTAPAPATAPRAERRPEPFLAAFATFGGFRCRSRLSPLDRDRTNRRGQKSRQHRLFSPFEIRLRTALTVWVEPAIAIPALTPITALPETAILMAVATALPVIVMLAFGARLRATLGGNLFPAFTGLGGLAAFALRPLAALIGLLLVLLLILLQGAEGEPIRSGVEIILVIIPVIGLPVLKGKLRLMRGSDDPIIMLGMLEIALRHHRISGEMRIAGQLGVFLGDMLRGAAHFHVRPVRFIRTRQRIGAAAIAATHTLVLSWSHWFLSCPKPEYPVLPGPNGGCPPVTGPGPRYRGSRPEYRSDTTPFKGARFRKNQVAQCIRGSNQTGRNGFARTSVENSLHGAQY